MLQEDIESCFQKRFMSGSHCSLAEEGNLWTVRWSLSAHAPGTRVVVNVVEGQGGGDQPVKS